jgi:ATPase subunit of ABC transporter with duplicated ATPase domains
VVSPICTVVLVSFSGFLERSEAIPIGWRWMNFVTFYTWAWRGLAINELSGLPLSFPSLQAPFTDGTDVLTSYNIDNDEYYKWFDMLWLVLNLICYALLGSVLILSVDWSRPDTPETPDFGEEAAARNVKAEQAKKTATKNIANDTGEKLPAQLAATEQTKQVDGEERETAGKPPRHQKSVSSTNRPFESQQRDGYGYFQWQQLGYTVTLSNGQERKLLTDCFGYAKPGLAVALMGASGAGKSTLLDVLAGKKTTGTVTGDISLNGKPFEAKSFNHLAAYGEQFDSHNALSTVKEAISFSALLRLPTHITSKEGEVERRVMHVMQQLDFSHSANDIIGSPGYGGVSPEVRKKVTIAVELVMDPALLFLDESTHTAPPHMI